MPEKPPVNTVTIETFGPDDFALRIGKIYSKGLTLESCLGTVARLLVVTNEMQKMDELFGEGGASAKPRVRPHVRAKAALG